VIDWNYHKDRADAIGDNDNARCTRKYNQRTKEWNLKVVKVAKDFAYIPLLMATIFKNRLRDVHHMDRHVSLSEDDPARIAPTIAHKPPISTEELVLKQKSRFLKVNKK